MMKQADTTTPPFFLANNVNSNTSITDPDRTKLLLDSSKNAIHKLDEKKTPSSTFHHFPNRYRGNLTCSG